MWRWTALIAAVVLIVAMAGVIVSFQPSIEPSHQQTTEKDHKENATEENKIGLFDRWFPDSTAVFNLFLVIFTAVLAFGGLIQLSFLNRAERISSNTAQAAKDAADVAKSNLLVGQRAYVYVTFSQVIVKDGDTKRVLGWNFTPVWNNSGPTPTRNMRNHISLKVFDGAIPDTWDFPDRWGKEVKIEDRKNVLLPLGPRSSLNGQTLFVNIDDIREIVAGKKALYIWGWAKYNDVFPNTTDHVTRFANRIVIGGDPTNPEKTSVSYPLHGKNNCSDEECEREGYPASWRPRETDE